MAKEVESVEVIGKLAIKIYFGKEIQRHFAQC
jgi:hypothetical protein